MNPQKRCLDCFFRATSMCVCNFAFCSNCLDLHECKSGQSSNAMLEPLLYLKRQLDQVISCINSFSLSNSNYSKDSKLLSTYELKNLIYLTFDYFSSNLSPYAITLRSDTLIIYDILSSCYQNIVIPNLKPTTLSSICYNTYGIFIVAGLIDFSPINTIFCLDYEGYIKETLELSEARYFCASVCYEQYLFVIGGLNKNNEALNTIEWFDFKNITKGVLKMKIPRERPSVTVLNGKVYIAGINNKKNVEIIDIKKMSLKEKKLSWAKGNIKMITNYNDKLMVLGDKGITGYRSKLLLKTWNKLDDMWSQQTIFGLDSFLYFFDYFTEELIRIFVADFRNNI